MKLQPTEEGIDLVRYILAQPRDRIVHMNEAGWVRGEERDKHCGCVMVQYALDKYKEYDYISCGMINIHLGSDELAIKEIQLGFSLSKIFNLPESFNFWNLEFTYGWLQDHLKPEARAWV